MRILSIITLFAIILFGCKNETSKFYALSTDAGNDYPIGLYQLSAADGSITIIDSFPGVKNGNYMAISKDQKTMLVTSKNSDQTQGGLVQYAIDEDGQLTKISEHYKPGSAPCYVSLSRHVDFAFSANYGTGEIAVWPLVQKVLSSEKQTITFEGNGPNKARQEGPHAHYIQSDASGKYVYAADLGTDKVMNFQFVDGQLTKNPHQEYLMMTPGSGPRHMAFHPTQHLVYILNELTSTVTSCRLNEKTGVLDTFQTISMLPKEFAGFSKAAAIRIHPSGQYLYASNRGYNSIAAYEIGEDGFLSLVGLASQNIDWPRDFQLSPDGKFLITCNMNSNNLSVFAINQNDGSLTYLNNTTKILKPLSIDFLN